MTGWAAGPSAEQLQAIKRLSPEAVQAYLSGEGWVPRQTAREGLWTLAEGADEFEVLVPYDRQVRDFSLRMYDLLRTLATIQDRPLPMVLADLAGAGADRMTLRLLPAGPPGTIALAHGAEAMQGVHDLVLAAAYASTLERPLPVQQGRRPQSVRDFARRARLRSPQAGSWVISVEIDVDDDLSDDIADELGDDLYRGEEQPSARQVSRALHGGLHASFLAATEALRDDPLEPFLRRVPEGVSANLCEALVRVGSGDTPFEVRFAWARGTPPPAVTAGSLRFEAPLLRALQQAGKELRTLLPDGPVEVTGRVTHLKHEPQGGGSARIAGQVRTGSGEEAQQVTVRLTPVQHEIAIRAYEAQQYLRLVGEVRHGRVDIVGQLEVFDPGNSPRSDR